MENLEDITEKLRFPPKKRENLSKVRVSECYKIVSGRMTLKEFVYGEETKPLSTYVMDSGTKKHEMIEGYLKDDYLMEQPIRKEVNGITITGTADMIKGDTIYDLKTSFNMLKCKEDYLYQVTLYLSLFDKQHGKIVQPIRSAIDFKKPDDFRVYLKTLGTCERDDEWFNQQVLLLKDFCERAIKKYAIE